MQDQHCNGLMVTFIKSIDGNMEHTREWIHQHNINVTPTDVRMGHQPIPTRYTFAMISQGEFSKKNGESYGQVLKIK